MSVYIALLHFPVYNKRQDVVTTCITGFDLHDIARSAITYGVKKYFVVNPLPAQREFAQRIFEFWMAEGSLEFNWTRAEAFKLISIKETLEQAVSEITESEGQPPKLIATSAKANGPLEFAELRAEIASANRPYLVMFGTGWGMTEELLSKADEILEPIAGANQTGYNHLSVRAAVAIILDRLLGNRKPD